MTLDVRYEQQNNYSPAQVQTTAAEDVSASKVIPLVNTDNSENNAPVKDTLPAAKIIDVNNIDEETKKEIIAKALGIEAKHLSNLNEKQLEHYTKCFEAAVKTLSSQKNVTEEDLINKVAEYNRQYRHHWGKKDKKGNYDFSNYESRQRIDKRGLTDRIKPYINKAKAALGKDAKEEEILKYAVKEFFKVTFGAKEKAGVSREEIIKQESQTIGRMLENSTPEERKLFMEIAQELCAENVEDTLESVLETLSEKDRIEVADKFDADYKANLLKPDRHGKRIAPKSYRACVTRFAQYQSKERLQSNHNASVKARDEFIKANKTQLENIKTKIENETELTQEEENLLTEYEYFEADASGEFFGTANSKVLEQATVSELLNTYNKDAYKTGEDFYRNVLKGIEELSQKHPEILTMTVKEFTELLNTATDGNYTNVLEGTKELNVPAADNNETTAENISETAGSSSAHTPSANQAVPAQQNIFTQNYTQNEINEKQKTINNLKETIENPQTTIKPTTNSGTLSVENFNKSEDYRNAVQSNGIIKTVKFIFDNLNNIKQQFANMAIASFKGINSELQIFMIQSSSGEALSEMIANLNDKSLLTNVDTNKMTSKKAEEKLNKELEIINERA